MSSNFDRGARPDTPPGVLVPVPHDPRALGLTYEPFYGLREKPFSLTSDARFFYQSRSHAPAFDDLLNAVRRRESLNVLTGDIGTGKTTLCRAVLNSLDRKTFSAFVPDPFASREDLLKILLIDFGVVSIDDLTSGRLRQATRTELSYLLYEFLGTLAPLQAFAVVFIDEAQNLSIPLLEETRILSDADGKLQVVLVGQLELREKLKLPEMRQLLQRVSVHCQLSPLDLAGVAGYISHRLRQAGGSPDRVKFSGDAVEAIYERSGGVPRIINRLCDRALRHGYARRSATIDREILEAANPPSAEDALAEETPAPRARPIARPPVPIAPAVVAESFDSLTLAQSTPVNEIAAGPIGPPAPSEAEPAEETALTERQPVEEAALNERQLVEGSALSELQRAEGFAPSEHERVEELAPNEHERVEGLAPSEHDRVEGPVLRERERVEGTIDPPSVFFSAAATPAPAAPQTLGEGGLAAPKRFSDVGTAVDSAPRPDPLDFWRTEGEPELSPVPSDWRHRWAPTNAVSPEPKPSGVLGRIRSLSLVTRAVIGVAAGFVIVFAALAVGSVFVSPDGIRPALRELVTPGPIPDPPAHIQLPQPKALQLPAPPPEEPPAAPQ